MYYLILNGAQAGPYPVEQIRTMVASGQVGPDALCWTEGQAEWQPVGQVLGSMPGAPPAIPATNRSGLRFFMGGVGITLAIIGAILLALFLVVGGLVGYAAYSGYKLDQSSKDYVDQAVPAIVTNWSKEELSRRESEAFQKVTSDEQLEKLFTLFRRLGALKSYNGCTGDSRVNYQVGQGKTITATYLAKATFENGDAEIKVTLIQDNGEWKIQGFRIDSPLYLK